MSHLRVTLAFAFTGLLILAAPSWRDVAYAAALAAGFVGIWSAWNIPKKTSRSRKAPKSPKGPRIPTPNPGPELPFPKPEEGGAP